MSQPAKKEQLSLEEMLSRLSAIAEEMSKEDIPLEKSMQLYEEGVTLAAECEKILVNAEQKIKKVTLTPDGELTEEEWNDVDK